MAAKSIPQKLYEFSHTEAWAGRRAKEVLRELLPDLSSRDAMLLFRNGLVSADGESIEDADAELTASISVDLRHGIHGQGKPKQPHLHDRMRVLYDDDSIIVVSKNPGTIVQPVKDEVDTAKRKTAPLVELVKHYWRANKKPAVNPIVVQRLDVETSGVLVMAKTAEAGRKLQQQLKPPRTMKREYVALALGEFQGKQGFWKSSLAKGPIGLRQSALSTNSPAARRGQMAITRYGVVKSSKQVTLLRLKLETGRTHQIRIHCAEAGHPLLGENVYTRLANNVLDRIAKGKVKNPDKDHPFAEAERLVREGILEVTPPKTRIPRIMLHAEKLSFIHPKTGKRVTFQDPIPEDMEKVIARMLGK